MVDNASKTPISTHPHFLPTLPFSNRLYCFCSHSKMLILHSGSTALSDLLCAFILLSNIPPFYTGVPKSATRITDFRLVPIAANPATAVVSRLCLKFLVCFRVPMFRLGIFVSLDLPDQLYIFTLQTFVLIAFMYFSHPFW